MENIWTESFKSVRKPFFIIEDPYTELTEEKCKKCGKSPCECEDEKYGEKEEKKYKKSGKKSKDYDGDGEVEDESDEYAGVKDRAIKKAMKEGYSASKKIKSNEKIDVKSGIQNKINTSPTIPEEFCAWVDSLLEEGYDLSDYTWDEMYEFYIEEETNDIEEMVDSNVSKSSLAQKKIRKEKADLELAKEMQKSPNLNTESVINYLNSRYQQI